MPFIKIPLNLISLALKNLWRRKARTLLTVTAVTIGTVAVISLVSIATGAKNVFLGQLEKTGALRQITIIASNNVESIDLFGGGMDDVGGEKMTDETVKEIKSVDHVIDVSPQSRIYTLRAINLKGSDKKYSVDILAVTPNGALEVPLSAGRFVRTGEQNKVVLSYKLAEALKRENKNNFDSLLGKTVVFTLEKGHFTQNMPIPENILREYFMAREKLHRQDQHEETDELSYPLDEITNTLETEIIGITTPGPQERDSYISMTWGKELMTRKHVDDFKRDDEGNPMGEFSVSIWDEIEERGYHTLIAKVDDTDNVESVAEEIRTRFNRGAITAKDFLEAFLRVFLIVQIALGGIGGIALLVASIGIINTMLMAVLERTREIGLLKAVGATGSMVGWIFTLEAGLIGLLGGLAGIGGGIILSEIVNRIASTQLEAQNFAVEDFITFPLWLIMGGLIFSFLVGVISGLYPALRASRLNPIDALRAE